MSKFNFIGGLKYEKYRIFLYALSLNSMVGNTLILREKKRKGERERVNKL
jgi:hypothetical protein